MLNKLVYTDKNTGSVSVVYPVDPEKIRESIRRERAKEVLQPAVEKVVEYEIKADEDGNEFRQEIVVQEYQPVVYNTDPVTDEDVIARYISDSIPEGIDSYREVESEDIPASREFRNAWVDVDETTKVNVCCCKAKEVALGELRRKRNKELDKSDRILMSLLDREENEKLAELRIKRQKLRDSTEKLKALETTGLFDDEEMLQKIRDEREQELDITV